VGLLLLVVWCATPDAGPPVAQFIRGGKIVHAARVIVQTKVSLAVADPPAQGMSDHQHDLDDAFAVFDDARRDVERDREDSAVAKLEAAAGGDAVELTQGSCELLAAALTVAKRSQGAFSFVRLKTDAGVVTAPSTELELKMSPPSKNLSVCSAKLKHAGAQLELGDVPFAVALDAVVKVWKAKGYRDFHLQAGPLEYYAGAVGDRAWHVELSGAGRKLGRLELTGTALGTFGDDASGSVRVETKTAVDALGLGWGVQKSAAEAGLAAVAAAGARGVFIDAAGVVKFSPALKGQISK